jgi:ribonuclease HI
MVQIWADGSFNPKTKDAGIGIIIRQMIKGGIKETRINLKTKAEDNNQAELLAIYHALQNINGVPKKEPVFIVTDSKIAIDSILHPETKKDKYRSIAERIRGMLYCENWRIYHKTAHTGQQDRYSIRQAITDKLAKKARQ